MLLPIVAVQQHLQTVHVKGVDTPHFSALLSTLGYHQIDIVHFSTHYWKHSTYGYDVEIRLSTAYWILSDHGKELKAGTGFSSFSRYVMKLHQLSLFSV